MPRVPAYQRLSPTVGAAPFLFFSVLALAALSVAPARCLAQSAAPSSPATSKSADGQQTPANAQKSDEDQSPTETLKVNVNVVGLFFNVKDKHGALIRS